ncbi:CPBP family intramembrane glutamic endopeptidase [Peloplasma aerotolerans]|uniref:Type II CAAX endopeptidase family protein n=1 Tax=Peloplasma aerotolerans TaxID=3044389 RepID=A0AAW6U316_9MOLU|nr:type II CAAX endopeptidase family protein [Mariniplasma sp. M4Ah]MDI6452346.1 type II CAAX endopeptidase family protein [Mariniplasma sp. M4Ah]
MAKENEIIKFEDLFKEEIVERKTKTNPTERKNYGYSILVYILIMYIFATVLFLVFSQISEFKVTYTETELVLNEVSADLGGLAFIDEQSFHLYANNYANEVVSAGIYENFHVIVNIHNEYYKSLLVKSDETLRIETLEGMIQSNQIIKQWSSGIYINIYVAENQDLPDTLSADVYILTGPVTQMTNFAMSLMNFVVYAALLPFIVYFLKNDLIYDFKEAKAMKGQFTVALVIGYLYLIFGNIIANYLSRLFSSLFNLPAVEAVNQTIISNALRSNGAVLMIISAVILGPIVEELIFRKAIFGLMKSDKWALFVSTFIFGSIHLIGEGSISAALVNGTAYFVMGFVFGYIYIKNNKNIWVPITIHVISNLISVVAIMFFI